MASEDAAWTVLVYMAGDNNLTEDMVWGLQELKKTAARLKAETALEPKERINVFAHFDPRDSRSRRYDFVPSVRSLEAAELETTDESGVGQQEAAELEAGVANDDGNLADYQAQIHTRKAVPSPPARQESKQQPVGKRAEATADPSALNPLAAFVSAQVRRLPPAKHYFVILSGHGSGAVGDFLIDSDPVTSLSIPKLAKILKAARTKYKEDTEQDKRIDILTRLVDGPGLSLQYSLGEALPPHLTAILAAAARAKDCAVAGTAAKHLDNQGDHRFVPRRLRSHDVTALMHALCVAATYQDTPPRPDDPLLTSYLPARGLELVRLTEAAREDFPVDDPTNTSATVLVPRDKATELIAVAIYSGHCKGTRCTSDFHDFRFVWTRSGADTVLSRLEIGAPPRCP